VPGNPLQAGAAIVIDEKGEGFDFEDEVIDHDATFEPVLDIDELSDGSASGAGYEDRRDHRNVFRWAADRGRDQLYEVADRGKVRLADVLEMAIDELDDRLSHTAHYLRTHDVEVIRDDFIQQVRRRPLLSAGLAVGTGYLLGKALGGSPRGMRGRLRARAGRQLRRALLGGVAAVMATGAKRESATIR
jgi:hypothetical protein